MDALGDIFRNTGNTFSCAWQVLRYLGGLLYLLLLPKAVLAARIFVLQSQLAICKQPNRGFQPLNVASSKFCRRQYSAWLSPLRDHVATCARQPVARYPWETAHRVNAATPIVSGDKIFISSGYGRGRVLLKLEGNALKKACEKKELNNHCQTSVLAGGQLYGVHGQQSQSSSLKCIEFETGLVKWDQKGLKVGGGLTLANGKLFVMVDGGELLVAEVSPAGLKQPARASLLSGTCWTVPVVANGRVYCRNQGGDLVGVDLR